MATNQNPFTNFDFTQFQDFSKIAGAFEVPNVDSAKLIETQRKNVEAITAANRIVFEGMQAMAQRQAEIFRKGMDEAAKSFGSFAEAGAPEDKLAKQIEQTKKAYIDAISNFNELTEISVKSNAEAAQEINKRVTESFDEVKGALHVNGKASKSK